MIDFIKDADCTKETPVKLGVPDAPIYGKGIKLKPRVDGRTDSEHFKKIYLPELLPLEEYDLIVVLISGGKDSVACYLKLLELGVPKERIEFWHHDIDGGHPSRRMDWKCTQNYVKALADAEGIKLRVSYRVNGFFGELYRIGASEPIEWIDPDTGEVKQCKLSSNYLKCKELKEQATEEMEELLKKYGYRMKFPAKTGDLSRRWCSAYLKICVADTVVSNLDRLGVDAFWEIKESPLEMTYKPTGQKIYFRGLDDPLKVTSITVDIGCLCWMWIEEAYEISSEDDFNMLDESIRGAVPEGSGLFKQITLTLNPWNEHHWIKKRFFDNTDDETLAMTTNYKCNEWLDKADLKVFETMKKQNPRRYKVAGLGDWGIVDGLVYENWEEKAFSVDEVKKIAGVKSVFGLDFGYTNDPSALFCGLIDQSSKTIWVFDEMYQPGMSNEAIAEQVQRMGYVKEKITADSAEPKSIDRLRELGLKGIRKARKGKDSINNGIDFIQDYHIIIHPRCVNFITEISNYQWDKDAKTGKKLNRPIDDFNHLMDAMRYAIEQMAKGDAFSFD